MRDGGESFEIPDGNTPLHFLQNDEIFLLDWETLAISVNLTRFSRN